MSKRKGDVQVFDYRVCPTIFAPVHMLTSDMQRRGWEPGAVLNWLALAGWGQQADSGDAAVAKQAPESTKLMSMDEMIREVHILSRMFGILCVLTGVPFSST